MTRKIPFGKPVIDDSEKNAVLEVLKSDVFVSGPKEKEFEKIFLDFTRAKYAVALSSCTAGLHLACFNLNLKRGDEVIVSAQTHVATAHAVEYCGGKPVFVDSEPHTGNIDVEKIESAISSNTRAIMLVHFLGFPVDMSRVMGIAKKHDLTVIEDCALSLGSKLDGIHVGNFGYAGLFSFYPIKHITTLEGGMLITNSEELAEKVRKQKAFGIDRTKGDPKIQGTYDVTLLGFNYRMNEVEAAIGVEQMKKIENVLTKRERNWNLIFEKLKTIDELSFFKPSDSRFKSSYYCFSFLLNEKIACYRHQIACYLNERGIGTSVYYPKPVPLMSYYMNKYRYSEESFKNAKNISERSLALPVGQHLDEEDVEFITNTIKEVIIEVRKK